MKRIVTLLAFGAALITVGGAHAQDEAKAKQLAMSKNCLTCHMVDKKLVGPAYQDVAKKYHGNKGAEEMLIKKVMTGGSGVWGQIPMPPNVIKEEEARILVEWILSMN